MSKVAIKYSVAGDVAKTVTGDSLIEAAVQIKSISGQDIFGPQSKPSIAALVVRTKRNGIDILDITVRGEKRFSSENQEASGQKPESKSWKRQAGMEDQKQEGESKDQKQDEKSKEQKQDEELAKIMAKKIQPHLDMPTGTDEAKVRKIVKEETDKMAVTIEIKPLEGKSKKMLSQHYRFPDLLAFVAQRINIMLVGPAGGFKTTATEKVAEALDMKHYGISVGMMTTKTDFLGFFDANGKYISTQFRQALEFGGVFNLDELDAGNPNVITTINMALSNGSAAFPDGMIKKHKDFVLIACANTFGSGADRQYVGRNQLDAATTDRFPMIVWDYDEKLELEIAGNKEWTKYIQKLRKTAKDKGLRIIISPRMSIVGAQMLASGMSEAKVKEYVVFKGLDKVQINQLNS